MQPVYVAGALALGVVIPRISVGSPVAISKATVMLVAVGAGFVPFIGIVYSMLFLVVRFGPPTFTPPLNLFRDDPIVWHAFSFFTAVIVVALTAAVAIGTESHTTLLVPIAVGVAVLAAIGLLRSLQAAAFKSIQLASILEEVSRRGRDAIQCVQPETPPAPDDDADQDASPVLEMPGGARDVLWPRRLATIAPRQHRRPIERRLAPVRT